MNEGTLYGYTAKQYRDALRDAPESQAGRPLLRMGVAFLNGRGKGVRLSAYEVDELLLGDTMIEAAVRRTMEQATGEDA